MHGVSWCSRTENGPAVFTTRRDHATRIQFRFVNTVVSDVLQSFSVQAHANIVFPAQLKKPVSINVAADSVKSALSFVAAAGGLAFRLAGNTYVVAPPESLRQALEPFGEQTSIMLKTIAADAAVKLVEGAFPYLTARPAGSRLMLIGAGEDIAKALALLQEQDLPLSIDPIVSEVDPVQYTSATQLATMLKTLYPLVRAEAVGQTDRKGGAIGLYGPKSQVEGAKQAILLADLPATSQGPDSVYRVYTIKYSSAPILAAFMTNAAPHVSTLIGPDNYSPDAPQYNGVAGASLGASSSSSSSSGSSGSSSGGTPSASNSSGGSSTNGPGGSSSTSSTSTSTTTPLIDGIRARFLVLRGTPADLDVAFKLLTELDVAPRQVMIEVKRLLIPARNTQGGRLDSLYQFSPLGLLEARLAGTAVSQKASRWGQAPLDNRAE